MTDFCATTYPVARKPHMCVECRETIAVGTSYARIAGATDGRGWAETMCSACHALHVEVWGIFHAAGMPEEDGPVFGELARWIDDADVADRLSESGQQRYLDVRLKLANRGRAAMVLGHVSPAGEGGQEQSQ